jgi:hypothetical protein
MTRFTVDDRSDGSVVVSFDARPILTYVYRSPVEQRESPRPFFHPMLTLSGEQVTQSRPEDHVWHAGLSWSLPNVGAHNFWGGPTYVRDRGYVQLPNNGRVEHRGFTAFDATDAAVEIEEQLQWTAEDGRLVFTEKRRITVTADDDHWTLGFATVMRNVTGEGLRLGSPSTEGRENAGYGGLFWRGPASMEHGDVHAAGADPGGRHDDAMGSRGEWMAYSSERASIVMVDGDDNPRHPTPWFVRTDEYAGLCPAPFFAEALDVPAGEMVRFRYSVVVADGRLDHGRAAALARSTTAEKDRS